MAASGNFLNENGLVDGDIPAGVGCPFWASCVAKTSRCPSKMFPIDVKYSCALARANSMVKSWKDGKEPA